MQYLIYVSSATQHFSEEDLKELLVISRRNNTAQGITGMLLYAEDNFIQVIEGDSEAVDALYSRISKDPRHNSISVLLRGEIQTRNFSQWSMGFKSISMKDYTELTGFKSLHSIDLDADNRGIDRPVLLLIKNFLKINSVEARYT